jgi:hypothetical protein
MKKLSLSIIAALLALQTHAVIVPLTVTVSGIATVQNPNSTDAKGITITPAPIRISITTKSLLTLLAADEFSEGNYSQATFPIGAKLIYLSNTDDISAGDFQVWDKNNTLLVDVSDIMSYGQVGSVLVQNSRIQDSTGLPLSENQLYIGEFVFDDTGAGGDLQLAFGGESSVTISAQMTGATTASGSISATLKGFGGGFAGGNDAIFSATFSAKGSVKNVPWD